MNSDRSAGITPAPGKDMKGEPMSPENARATPSRADVSRFEPSRVTLLIDRFMTHFIKIGGISIIAAVLGIFVFILWQILPLFQHAKVKMDKSIPIPAGDYKAIGIDEWGELPFLLNTKGELLFVDMSTGKAKTPIVPPFSEPKDATAFRYDQQRQDVIYGTSDGFFSIVSIQYGTEFQGENRQVMHDMKASPFFEIGDRSPILAIDYGETSGKRLVACIQDLEGERRVYAVTMIQETTLLGAGEIRVDQSLELTSQINEKPLNVMVSAAGTDLLVAAESGNVHYFSMSGDQIQKVQVFQPFADLPEPTISSIDFVLGGTSIVVTAPTGENRGFSLYRAEGADVRMFGQTKVFPRLPSGAGFYAASLRNKAFLIGTGSMASLRYNTTESVRWEENLPFSVQLARIGGKYNLMVFLDTSNNLDFYTLSDPHPETSIHALLGRVWYEGASAPKYEWQSTGASDDFEQKLSLVPLIIGTLKGTFYAMLFAVPIALLAAIYTSQFLHPSFRIFVKPTMEIMASLPSVVLGFLAALWLAPLVETKVPSILLILIILPSLSFLCGWIWNLLPIRYRVLVRPGYEWLVFLPLLAIGCWLGWVGGPILERMLFVVTDASTGERIADFRLWWPRFMNLPFEQRNSLVVGFMMGFAVIPIIFTITEDALSNVPPALRSASLALGASRWQTAMRIVIPTASAGIFSAVMIGLGRAVGETMIVVMATGNTPILDFNIFSGMRTLSANIAVELPEAPVHGTLYRTLFLGGLVLFVMTFMVNTLAEVLRQHLREKYKTV